MNSEVVKNFRFDLELQEKYPHKAVFFCKICKKKIMTTAPVTFEDMCKIHAPQIDTVLSFHLMECPKY